MDKNNLKPQPDFYGLGIAPKLLDILKRLKFKVPTPIQYQTIPLAIQSKDIIGIAQTGTGKTHSFAIPMVQRLAGSKGRGLILAPTRELAIQIDEAIKKLARAFKMDTACLIGGVPMNGQIQALRKNPNIVIATPGRFIDHVWQGDVLLDNVVMLVLDEADRMLDMGFAQDINQIFNFLPKNRQTMLFSATMPKEIVQIANKQMKLPVRVEIAPSGTTAASVTQEVFIIKKEAKTKLLSKLLAQYCGPILLFVRTKHGASKVVREIHKMKCSAAEMHSDRSLSQRCAALEGFKSGRYKVLVATDVAARGIDVTGIQLVINYDLPHDAENYVHRIGRTARAGKRGHAISFATPDQKRDIQDIEKLVKSVLPISHHPDLRSERFIESSRPNRAGRPPKR
ncbi:MAG: DEAD/DEAH box helicase [Candidatus Omnitrophica bacterium]|nr:DEAD/DEAH box helicase [Candidatus Omnitrophota bacterium]